MQKLEIYAQFVFPKDTLCISHEYNVYPWEIQIASFLGRKKGARMT